MDVVSDRKYRVHHNWYQHWRRVRGAKSTAHWPQGSDVEVDVHACEFCHQRWLINRGSHSCRMQSNFDVVKSKWFNWSRTWLLQWLFYIKTKFGELSNLDFAENLWCSSSVYKVEVLLHLLLLKVFMSFSFVPVTLPVLICTIRPFSNVTLTCIATNVAPTHRSLLKSTVLCGCPAFVVMEIPKLAAKQVLFT